MKRTLQHAWLLVLLASTFGACAGPTMTVSTSDLSDVNNNPDFTGEDLTGVDLTESPPDLMAPPGQDLFGADFAQPPPPDMTMVDLWTRPDGPSVQLLINWTLWNCYSQSPNINCPYMKTCGDVGATSITFTATNDVTGHPFMTTIPCPTNLNSGDAVIAVPNEPGSVSYFGKLDQVSTSGCVPSCHSPEGVLVDVNIYSDFCTDSKCNVCN